MFDKLKKFIDSSNFDIFQFEYFFLFLLNNACSVVKLLNYFIPFFFKDGYTLYRIKSNSKKTKEKKIK